MARLCLDCEEVHDEYRCPACASDHFSYLTRWVSVPERADRPERPPRPRPPAQPRPEVDVYRRLIHGEPPPRKGGRLVTRALMGLGAAAGLAGLFLGARGARAQRGSDDDGAGDPREPDR
jgi:hypothetical protein